MSKFFRIFSLSLLFWGMTGCFSSPEPVSQEGVFIVWKTPTMRYADQGFLYHEGTKLRLEIYASGQPVMQLTVAPGHVCSGALCLSEKAFYRRSLSPAYPDGFLRSVLEGQPLFGGAGLKKEAHGFTQKIEKAGEYSIQYSVLNGSIVFRDTINDILIKIRKG